MGGGQLHGVVDIARAHVQRAPEHAGEGQDVVNLVGKIAPAGTHHRGSRRPRLVGHHLGHGVGHGEKNGVPGH